MSVLRLGYVDMGPPYVYPGCVRDLNTLIDCQRPGQSLEYFKTFVTAYPELVKEIEFVSHRKYGTCWFTNIEEREGVGQKKDVRCTGLFALLRNDTIDAILNPVTNRWNRYLASDITDPVVEYFFAFAVRTERPNGGSFVQAEQQTFFPVHFLTAFALILMVILQSAATYYETETQPGVGVVNDGRRAKFSRRRVNYEKSGTDPWPSVRNAVDAFWVNFAGTLYHVPYPSSVIGRRRMYPQFFSHAFAITFLTVLLNNAFKIQSVARRSSHGLPFRSFDGLLHRIQTGSIGLAYHRRSNDVQFLLDHHADFRSAVSGNGRSFETEYAASRFLCTQPTGSFAQPVWLSLYSPLFSGSIGYRPKRCHITLIRVGMPVPFETVHMKAGFAWSKLQTDMKRAFFFMMRTVYTTDAAGMQAVRRRYITQEARRSIYLRHRRPFYGGGGGDAKGIDDDRPMPINFQSVRGYMKLLIIGHLFGISAGVIEWGFVQIKYLSSSNRGSSC